MPTSVCRAAARTSMLVLPAFSASCSSLRSAVTKSPLVSLAGVWGDCGRGVGAVFMAGSFGVDSSPLYHWVRMLYGRQVEH